MAGHCNKIRSQFLHINRQHPRRLGGIHHEGNTVLPAQRCHLIHRQNIAKHIGSLGENGGICAFFQSCFKAFQGIFRAE